METLPENSMEQTDNFASTPVTSLGVTLREARERLGLSVTDVADQIKFAPRQIEALEADDLTQLPEITFVRGFVRSYARILHLDAQVLLEMLPKIDANPVQLVPASIDTPFDETHSVQRQNLVWLGAALLLAVVVVAFAVWHFTTPVAQPKVTQLETPVALPAEVQIQPASAVPETGAVCAASAAMTLQASSAVKQARTQAENTLSAQGAPSIKPEKAAPQSGAPVQKTALHLIFDEESWVEIKDKDGNILASRIGSVGSELRLDGSKPFSLVIGHAAGVRLYYHEKLVELKPHTNVDVARLTLE